MMSAWTSRSFRRYLRTSSEGASSSPLATRRSFLIFEKSVCACFSAASILLKLCSSGVSCRSGTSRHSATAKCIRMCVEHRSTCVSHHHGLKRGFSITMITKYFRSFAVSSAAPPCRAKSKRIRFLQLNQPVISPCESNDTLSPTVVGQAIIRENRPWLGSAGPEPRPSCRFGLMIVSQSGVPSGLTYSGYSG
jgi:hypothetical protein